MRERIIHIIKSLGITQKQFAEQVGITAGGLTDYIKGRSKDLSGSTIANVAIKFNVNPTWLLTGDGEMFIDNKSTSASSDQQEKPCDIGHIRISDEAYNLIRDIIEEVDRMFEEERWHLASDKKAELIMLLYEDICNDREKINRAELDKKIIRLSKLAR